MVGAEPARTWEQNGLSIDCSSWQLFCVEETILSLLFLSFFFLDTKRRCDAPWKRGRKREWLSEVRINCAICLRLLSVRQSSSAWHLHYTWEITSLERNLQLARSWSVPRFFFWICLFQDLGLNNQTSWRCLSPWLFYGMAIQSFLQIADVMMPILLTFSSDESSARRKQTTDPTQLWCRVIIIHTTRVQTIGCSTFLVPWLLLLRHRFLVTYWHNLCMALSHWSFRHPHRIIYQSSSILAGPQNWSFIREERFRKIPKYCC